MRASTAKGVASVGFLVLISLGIVPLVQWFMFSRANGVIATVFGRHGSPAVWLIPAGIAVIAVGVMWYFGDRAERAG